MEPTGSRAGEGEEKSAPQKDGYAPGAAFAPDGDVTSGAEEAEWCSEGQTKGGAGGAQWPAVGQSGRGSGLPAGRPGAAGPGRRLPWSERNAKTLPRQTWASLSTISQLADSRAILKQSLHVHGGCGPSPGGGLVTMKFTI